MLKSSAIALSSMMVFSGLGGISAHASERINPNVAQENLNNSEEITIVQDEKFDQYVESLEKFVQKNSNGTISLNENYKTLNIPVDVINGINEWMDYLNQEVVKGTVTIQDDLSVSYTTPNISQQKNYQSFATVAAASKGKNAFRSYWWGYKVYLNNKNTKLLVDSIYNGATGAGLAAVFSSAIPGVGNIVIKGVAAGIAAVGGAAGRQISGANNGKGVYLRFTGKLGPAGVLTVYTGAFAQ